MNALLSQLQDKGFDPRSLAFHCVSIILRACRASRKSTSAARMRRQNWRWRRNRNLLVSPPESPWGQQFLVGGARCREAAVKSIDQRTGGDEGLGIGRSAFHAMKRHVKAEKRGAEKLQLNHMACASLNTPASYRPTPAGEALPIPARGADSGSRKGAARCMLCPVWVGPRCTLSGAERRRTAADECAAFPAPGQRV